MPCPHSNPSTGRKLGRRDFLRAAVVIGGTSAFSACMETAGTPDVPQGGPDRSVLPDQQHAWGEYLLQDEHGNPKFPEYQAFVFLNYVGDGVPTDEERDTVETAFRTLEEAYVWGAGEQTHETFFHDGVFFTIGYSPRYFDRFDAELPPSVDLRRAEAVHRAIDEDPAKADQYDAVLHLATDIPQVLLSMELALFGELEEINNVEVEDSLDGVFERAERRAGFVGRGLPKEHLDNDEIHERAPLSMGFKSALKDNLPSEDKVTIGEGPFTGSTIQHISRIVLDLDEWYKQSHDKRVKLMYTPDHTSEEVGKAGQFLITDSGITAEHAEQISEDAEKRGTVGHSQKLARARDEDFDPIILRRGDFNGVHSSGSLLHFGSLQRRTEDIITTLRTMHDVGFDPAANDATNIPEVKASHDGILDFMKVTNRGNFLMPSREDRALPVPNP